MDNAHWNLSSKQQETLKYIAIISMVADHANTILWDRGLDSLFAFGRLAFPLFCFLLAYNYVYRSQQPKRWLQRLWLMAIVTQPIFMWAFGHWQGNIFFTLALGLSLSVVIDRFRLSTQHKTIVYGLLALAIFLAGSFVEYFQAGVIAVPLLVYWLRRRDNSILILALFNFMAANFFLPQSIFVVLAFGLIPLILLLNIAVPRLPRFWYYSFYPAHLLVLKLLSF